MLGSSGMGPRFGRDVWWERRYKKVWVIVLDTFPVRDGGELETTTSQPEEKSIDLLTPTYREGIRPT
jgi:hypothetical protein